MRHVRLVPVSLSAAVFLFFSLHSANAAVDKNGQIELMQTQASIAFHSGKNQECARIIDSILSTDPDNTNALELQALLYKSEGKTDAAAKVYEHLIKSAERSKKPAYHFELATILFKDKKLKEAREHFQVSARKGFNKGTSHFFLGMIDTGDKNWVGASKNFSTSLLYADAGQMKAISRFYLATANAQDGKSTAAIRNYVQTAFDVADPGNSSSPLASQYGDLKKNAIEAIKTYNQSQFFGTASYTEQYDSNVLELPDSISTGQQASGKKSLKSIITAVAGYSSSPTGKFQFVPSNSIYGNFNYTYQSRTMNFLSDTPSFYAFYKPFARLTPGIKLEGTYNAQRQLSSDGTKYQYRSYSLTGNFGGLLRYAALPTLDLAFELTYQPKKYFGESENDPSRRTGRGYYARFSSEWSSEYEWLSPTVALSYQWDNTLGTTYKARVYGFTIQNPLYLSDKWTLTPGIDELITEYYLASPSRSDNTTTFRATGYYKWRPKMLVSLDASFTKNNSTNSSSFSYSRLVTSAGLTYSF